MSHDHKHYAYRWRAIFTVETEHDGDKDERVFGVIVLPGIASDDAVSLILMDRLMDEYAIKPRTKVAISVDEPQEIEL